MPFRIAASALSLLAFAAPLHAAPFTEIDRAATAHEIDAAQATAYRYFAVFEPDRLPARFRADAHPTLRCATGLRQEALSAQLPSALRPRPAQALALCDRASPFQVNSAVYPLRVHWYNPEDEEAAMRTLSAAERGWRVQVESLGFSPPLADAGACGGDDRLDLFLTRGLGSAYTAAMSDDPATPNDDWSTYIAIDPLAFPGPYLESTTVHEFNHALQAADDWWEILTTLESSATYIEEYMYDELNSYLPTLASFQYLAAFPYEMNDDYSTYFMYGAVTYLIFLEERYFPGDPAFIGRAWHGMRSPARGAFLPRSLNEPDFSDAFDVELRAHAGVSYADSVRELARWRWFAGTRDDGRHFSEGASWTRAPLKTHVVTLPYTQTIVAPQLGGVAYFQVGTAGAPDSALLRLALASDDAREWHVEVLHYDAGGNHDDWSPVLDVTGAGRARVPVLEAAQIILLVQRSPPPEYDPDYYRTSQQPLRIEIEELTE